MTPEQRRRYNRTYYLKQKRARGAGDTTQLSKKSLVQFRLEDSMIVRVIQLKEQAMLHGTYPFRSTGEAYRWLVFRGYETLKDDPLVEIALPFLKLEKHAEAIHQPRKEAEGVFAKVSAEIHRLLEIKAEDQAVRFYHQTRDLALDMTATVWRDWLLEQLTQAFPELDKQMPKGVSVSYRQPKTSDEREADLKAKATPKQKPVRKARKR